MRSIAGDKADKFKSYVLASEAISVERELKKLQEELTSKNNFPACCAVINQIPGVIQSFVAWQMHMDEKRISKMSGVWDTGVTREMDYRVCIWAKNGCADRTHKSLRAAVQECCDELHLKFPEELE